LNIILNFEKASNHNILEFNNKIKNLYNTFKELDLDLIFPEFKIKCIIKNQTNMVGCSIFIKNHNDLNPDLSNYKDLFESGIFDKFITDFNAFKYNPLVILLDKDHNIVINNLCEFIFLFFKTTKNSLFL